MYPQKKQVGANLLLVTLQQAYAQTTFNDWVKHIRVHY